MVERANSGIRGARRTGPLCAQAPHVTHKCVATDGRAATSRPKSITVVGRGQLAASPAYSAFHHDVGPCGLIVTITVIVLIVVYKRLGIRWRSALVPLTTVPAPLPLLYG